MPSPHHSIDWKSLSPALKFFFSAKKMVAAVVTWSPIAPQLSNHYWNCICKSIMKIWPKMLTAHLVCPMCALCCCRSQKTSGTTRLSAWGCSTCILSRLEADEFSKGCCCWGWFKATARFNAVGNGNGQGFGTTRDGHTRVSGVWPGSCWNSIDILTAVQSIQVKKPAELRQTITTTSATRHKNWQLSYKFAGNM